MEAGVDGFFSRSTPGGMSFVISVDSGILDTPTHARPIRSCLTI